MGLVINIPDAQYTNYLRVIPKIQFNFMSKSLNDIVSGFSATVGRTTIGTYVDSDGFIKTAAIAAPRYDYNPATLALRGLLVEGTETNVFQYSENITSWYLGGTISNLTLSAGARLAPDNTTSMTKLVEAVTNSSHYVFNGKQACSPNYFATFSCFVAAGERSIVRIGLPTFNSIGSIINSFEADFDSSTGLSTTVAGTGTIEAEYYVASNCWRVSLIVATGATEVECRQSFALLASAGVASYLGVSGYGLYIWGLQYAPKPSVGSYIKTAGAAVTRGNENIFYDDTKFSNAFNPVQGTIYVKATARNRNASVMVTLNTAQVAAALCTSVYGDVVLVGRGSLAPNINNPKAYIDDTTFGGSTDVFDAAKTWKGNTLKAAVAYQLGNSSLVADGGTPVTVPHEALGLPVRFQIGSGRLDAEYWDGWINEASLYGLRLTDPVMQVLTTA